MGQHNIALGCVSFVLGEHSGAFMHGANVIGDHSVAIGSDATITPTPKNALMEDGGHFDYTAFRNLGYTLKRDKNTPLSIKIPQGEVNIDLEIDNALALGAKSTTRIDEGVALGYKSIAAENAIVTKNLNVSGYDVTTGGSYNGNDRTSSTWQSTLSAISIGNKAKLSFILSMKVNMRQWELE